MLGGVGELVAGHAEHRDIGREHLAALVGVRHGGVGPLLESLQVVRNFQAVEEVGHAQRVGGLIGYADARAGQLESACDVLGLAHQKALSVIDQYAGEADAERGVKAGGDSDVARQHIDVACLQRRETVAWRQRTELHRVPAAEHGSRQSPAEIDADAGPRTLRVDRGIALGAIADPTQQMTASADRIEHASVRGRGGEAGQSGKHERSRRAERPADSQCHCISPAASSDAESHTRTWRQRRARCPRSQPYFSRDEHRFGHCRGKGQVLTSACRWARRRRHVAGNAHSNVWCVASARGNCRIWEMLAPSGLAHTG